MAGRDRIELEVVINQEQLLKSLTDALERSPEVLEKVAAAVNPIDAAFGDVIDKVELFEKKLATIANQIAAIDTTNITLQQGAPTQEQTRASALLLASRQEGEVGAQALQQLLTIQEQITERVKERQLITTGYIRDIVTLNNIQEGLAQLEERKTEARIQGQTELNRLVKEQVQIAKAGTERSPEAVERLITLEQELANRIENTAENTKESAELSRLLITVRNQLARSEAEITKEIKAQVSAYSDIIKASPESSFAEDAVRELIKLRDQLQVRLEEENLSARDTADTLKLQKQVIDSINAAKQETAEEASKVAQVEEDQLTRLQEIAKQQIQIAKGGTERSPEAVARLIDLEQDLVKAIEQTADKTEEQADLSKTLVAVRRQLASSEAEVTKEIRAQIQAYSQIIQSSPESSFAQDAVNNLNQINEELQLRLEESELNEQQIAETLKLQADIKKQIAKVQGDISNQVEDTTSKEVRGLETLKQLVKDQISIAKARTDISAAALRQLNSLEEELNAKTLKSANNTELAAQYSRLLVQVKRTLVKEEVQVADELEKQVKLQLQLLKYADSPGLERSAIRNLEAAEQEIEARLDIAETEEEIADLLKLQTSIKDELKKIDQQRKREADERIQTLQAEANLAVQVNKLKQTPTNVSEIEAIRTRGEGAIEELIEERERLLAVIAKGKLTAEEEAEAIIRLNRLIAATTEERRQAVSGLAGVENALNKEIETQAILSRTTGERRIEAVKRLNALKLEQINIIQDETASIEELENAQIRLEKIQRALAGGGAGRRARRNQRALEGPDAYGAVLDLGRIIQDAPYGLVGVANNLGPFFDQFSTLFAQFEDAPTKVAQLGQTLQALGKATLFTPIGWIALLNAVTSLIIIIPKLTDYFSGLTEEEKKAREEAEKLAEEQKKLREQGFEIGDAGFFELGEQIALVQNRLNSFIQQREQYRKQQEQLYSELRNQNVSLTQAFIQGIGGANNQLLKDLNEVDEVLLSLGENIEGVQQQLDTLNAQRAAEAARVAATVIAALSGSTSALQREFENSTAQLDRELAEQRLILANNNAERIAAQRDLLEAEERQQRQSLTTQLLDIQAQQEAVREETEKQIRETTLTPDVSGQVTAALAEVDRLFDAQAEGVQDQLDNLDEVTQAKLDDYVENLKGKTKEVVADFSALRYEIEQARIRLQEEGTEELLQLAEAETKERKRELRQQVEDFEGSQREKLILQQLVNIRLIQLDQELAAEQQAIRDQARQEELERVREYQDLRIQLQENNLERIAGVEGQVAQAAFDSQQTILQYERQIQDLRLDQEDEYADRKIAILERLIDQEQDLQRDRESDIRRQALQQDLAVLRSYQRDYEDAVFARQEFELESTEQFRRNNTELIKLRAERSRQLAFYAFQDKITRANELQDLQAHFEAVLEAWKAYREDLNRINDEENQQLVEDQFRILTVAQQRVVDFLTSQIDTIGGIMDLSYQNWEARRRAQLEREGKTEEEATEIIDKEGKKRLDTQKKWAKLQIVVNTAQAAMDAFTSAMNLPIPLWAKLPLAIASAGIATEFGRQQYRAVDNDTIQGSGGSSGGNINITTGEEAPPGLINQNPLQIGTLGQNVNDTGVTPIYDNELIEEVRGLNENIERLVNVNEGRPVIATIDDPQQVVETGQQLIRKATRGS